jgi:hypothetical protein
MTSTIASTADVFDLQRRRGVRAEIVKTDSNVARQSARERYSWDLIAPQY